MSSLPSISHRLFVAAVGQERPSRSREMRDQSGLQSQSSQDRPSPKTDLEDNQATLAPLIGEITARALGEA